MSQVNNDILPAQPGLNLGSRAQPWNVHAQDVEFQTQTSANGTSATTGTIRLAVTDLFAWRNNADDGDLTFGPDASDILTWPGFLKVLAIISGNSNPAQTGFLRLSAADALNTRNNGDTADLNLLKLDSSDRAVVGDSNGAVTVILTSGAVSHALSGFLRMGNGEQILWRNSFDTGDQGLRLNGSDQLEISALTGLLLSGTTPDIYMGGTTNSFPLLKRNGTNVDVRLADNSDYASINAGNLNATSAIVYGTTLGGNFGNFVVGSKITVYNGRTTTGEGVPSFQANVDLTGQNAAIGTTSLITLSSAGMYRISYYFYITTVGAAVNLTGTIGWNDGAAAHTVTTANIACNALNDSTLIGQPGSVTFYSAAGQSITYATALSGSIVGGFYAVRIRAEFLG